MAMGKKYLTHKLLFYAVSNLSISLACEGNEEKLKIDFDSTCGTIKVNKGMYMTETLHKLANLTRRLSNVGSNK